MNRTPRTLIAVLLAFALLVAVAPVAQARTLAKPQPTPRLNADGWLDAALMWVGSFFIDAPRQPRQGQNKATITLSTDGGTGGASPMTGSCIDPNGCTFGGWGGI